MIFFRGPKFNISFCPFTFYILNILRTINPLFAVLPLGIFRNFMKQLLSVP